MYFSDSQGGSHPALMHFFLLLRHFASPNIFQDSNCGIVPMTRAAVIG